MEKVTMYRVTLKRDGNVVMTSDFVLESQARNYANAWKMARNQSASVKKISTWAPNN